MSIAITLHSLTGLHGKRTAAGRGAAQQVGEVRSFSAGEQEGRVTPARHSAKTARITGPRKKSRSTNGLVWAHGVDKAVPATRWPDREVSPAVGISMEHFPPVRPRSRPVCSVPERRRETRPAGPHPARSMSPCQRSSRGAADGTSAPDGNRPVRNAALNQFRALGSSQLSGTQTTSSGNIRTYHVLYIIISSIISWF